MRKRISASMYFPGRGRAPAQRTVAAARVLIVVGMAVLRVAALPRLGVAIAVVVMVPCVAALPRPQGLV